MALHASTVVASELARTILVTNYFYRVRMEAARALVNVRIAILLELTFSSPPPSASTLVYSIFSRSFSTFTRYLQVQIH